MSNSSDELRLEEHMIPSQQMIIFQVAPDSGSGFSARAADHPIFIQGDTIDELRQNADDAVRCHFAELGTLPLATLRFDYGESRPT